MRIYEKQLTCNKMWIWGELRTKVYYEKKKKTRNKMHNINLD